ncbi:MAG: hypothetical protein KGD64_11645, partial [Candidatus Heimdallarchaeota archaeon]|nr:hypothetical protein [Candidatus Heimdallarchaeota archaeon]
DIREGTTYVFDQITKGLGGLPVGCQGKILVIIDGENEDIANVLQLYKRGAITVIYSIKEFPQYPKTFQDSITKLLALQPNLRKSEKIFSSILPQLNSEEILGIYQKTQCLSMAVSKSNFEKISDMIPVSIPIFVPYLVEKVNEKEISIFAN